MRMVHAKISWSIAIAVCTKFTYRWGVYKLIHVQGAGNFGIIMQLDIYHLCFTLVLVERCTSQSGTFWGYMYMYTFIHRNQFILMWLCDNHSFCFCVWNEYFQCELGVVEVLSFWSESSASPPRSREHRGICLQWEFSRRCHTQAGC